MPNTIKISIEAFISYIKRGPIVAPRNSLVDVSTLESHLGAETKALSVNIESDEDDAIPPPVRMIMPKHSVATPSVGATSSVDEAANYEHRYTPTALQQTLAENEEMHRVENEDDEHEGDEHENDARAAQEEAALIDETVQEAIESLGYKEDEGDSELPTIEPITTLKEHLDYQQRQATGIIDYDDWPFPQTQEPVYILVPLTPKGPLPKEEQTDSDSQEDIEAQQEIDSCLEQNPTCETDVFHVAIWYTERGGKGGIDTQDDDGFSALLRAVEKGYCSVVGRLLRYGADKKMPSFAGESSLVLAASRNDLRMVNLLLEYRDEHGDEQSDKEYVNTKGPNGQTALMWAYHWENQEMVQLLIQEGAVCAVEQSPPAQRVQREFYHVPYWVRVYEQTLSIKSFTPIADAKLSASGVLPVPESLATEKPSTCFLTHNKIT